MISWPFERNKEENNGKAANGHKIGDKAKLVDISTGNVLKIRMQEDHNPNDAGNSDISVKSPLGKALLGKRPAI